MTLGQRIQELRKQKGLSQEALGEALGVSRQAISKWEGDLTIPEIDKLIALSRLFALPVGQLLGVEEPVPEGPAAPEELSPREVELVNAIAGGYWKQAQAGRARRDRRNLVLAVAVGLAAAGLLWFGATLLDSRLDALAGRVAGVEQQVSSIDNTVDQQMSALAAEMEAALDRQNALVEEWSYTLEGVEPGGMCRLAVTVTPKEYTPGNSAAVLSLTVPGEEPVFATGDWMGQAFRFALSVPAVSQVEVRVSLWKDGVQQTQLLTDITDLARRVRLNLTVEDGASSVWYRHTNTWKGTCDLSWAATAAWSDEGLGLRPAFFQLRWEKNGEVLDRQEVEIQELTAIRFIGEAQWARTVPLEQAGDEYALRYWMRDSLGQDYQGDIFRFRVVEGTFGLETENLPLEAPAAWVD